MAFTLPTFNLLCNVYTGPWLTRVLRVPDLPCNLAVGRRVQVGANFAPFTNVSFVQPILLVPALSDVRDQSCSGDEDVIECPSGSGRWYQAIGVDDSGKGFSNEHRVVMMSKIYQEVDPVDFAGLHWPTPIP